MKKLIEEIIRFRDARNWKQFHNPKDLTISLNLEAAELLELFQWKSSNDAVLQNKEKMKEEIADILTYTLLLCHELDINPTKIVQEKLEKNGEKYPINKAFGSNKKYTQL